MQKEARRPLLELARKYHFFAVAIALNLPESLCYERNQQRPNRQFGPHVVRNHTKGLRRSLKGLKREGFRYIYTLDSLEAIEAAKIERQPLWNNRKYDHGPFDIIGDLHGCCDELEQLLQQLGYQPQTVTKPTDSFWNFPVYTHPEGRRALFLGDLVDRGPRILDTVKLVHNMVTLESAVCIMGNHENKLLRLLNGRKVNMSYGLEQTVTEIEAIEENRRDQDKAEIRSFLSSLISHYVLDEGKLVVAHAGLREELQGRGSGYVRDFALYGETTGETDEFGRRVRYNWATDYRGKATVVYGHTPVMEPAWLNNTIDIDTGCVYGGRLTAICYTRTGRRFFNDSNLETAMLSRINEALDKTEFWKTFETDWVCLDCELIPWSAKAQGLLQQQYAPVSVAAQQGLNAAITSLKQAASRSTEVNDLLSRYQHRAELAQQYVDAYRRYCWPVTALNDLKLAPFHILATEGKTHSDRTHEWHMQQITQITEADPKLLLATQRKIINVENPSSCAEGTHWWESLTANGGEGMVVKSIDFIHQTERGPLQPAVKCRGAEYLRIIYGPEYTLPENLERLRQRGLGRKRSLALREFSLGIESLERFVAKAPLRQVHECVFGVLALESEPVDPRL